MARRRVGSNRQAAVGGAEVHEVHATSGPETPFPEQRSGPRPV